LTAGYWLGAAVLFPNALPLAQPGSADIISVFLIIASLTPSTQLDALAALAAGQRSAQGRSSYMSLAAKQLHLGLL